MAQYHRRLQALLHGRRLSEVLQLSLAVRVQTVAVEKPPRRPRGRSRKAIEATALQMGLLVA